VGAQSFAARGLTSSLAHSAWRAAALKSATLARNRDLSAIVAVVAAPLWSLGRPLGHLQPTLRDLEKPFFVALIWGLLSLISAFLRFSSILVRSRFHRVAAPALRARPTQTPASHDHSKQAAGEGIESGRGERRREETKGLGPPPKAGIIIPQ
jgi:hypothetical protein